MMDLFNNIGYLLIDAIELGLIWCLLSLGIYISFRVLDYADMTCESSFTLGAATSTTMILNSINPFIALFCGALSGAIAGIITGLLHVKLKIPALLAGIITMIGLYSVNLRIMKMANLSLINASTIFSNFYNSTISNQYVRIIISVILVIIFFLILYYFFGTEIGMSLRATGMNINMAKAEGINTSVMIIVGLAISNSLIGLSGGLAAQAQGFADINMGRGVIIIGLASIIIGEAVFGKRTFKNCLISTILGTLLYYILLGIAIRIGFDPNDLKLLSSILIVMILSLPLIKSYTKNHKKGGNKYVKPN